MFVNTKDFAFAGLNLAVATPFSATGAIDFNQLEKNLEAYLAVGVTSFVLSSGTGIHVYLTESESKELILRGSKILKGRGKFIAQTSALLTDDVIARTRFAAECGAAGVMVLPPFFEGPVEDDEVVEFYGRVSDVGVPIIGYNVPQSVGLAVTPSLLVKLCSIANFSSVKDSGGDMSKHAELIATGHAVMNGADQLVPYSLFAGGSGLIWGGANFAPRSCLAIATAAAARNWEEVRAIWSDMQPIMSLISQADYIKSVYAAADIMGYSAGALRKPFSALPRQRVEAIRAALEPLRQRECR